MERGEYKGEKILFLIMEGDEKIIKRFHWKTLRIYTGSGI